MAQTVDVAFVQAFQNVLVGLNQTKIEGIRSTVRSRMVTGKYDHWERLGGVEMVQRTSRHAPTPHTPMTHTRRRCVLSDWQAAEFLDPLDEPKMLVDPKNEYTQNLAAAWERRVARTLVTALNAAVTVVAADDTTSTSALQASQVIANGGTGFTMAKWRQANRILDNAGVPRGGRSLLISAFGIEDLLADSQVTSKDYNDLSALKNGTVDGAMFMGATVKLISDAIPDETATLTGGTANPILPKSGNIRTCFLYHHDGVGLSIGKEARASISTRNDLSDAWQALFQGSVAACRILDASVVTIDIDESV